MKGFLLPGVLAGGVVSGGVQQKVSTNSEVMKTNTSTIRLIYPQWQGGNVAAMVPEVKDPDDAARGYYLGAQLLDFLAPCGGQETLTVPVSTQIGERRVTDGVLDRNVILRQTKAALEMLRASDPGRIVTLGGDCSVSVVPFTYLAAKYGGDVAMVWIDAHPDITLPGDPYPGYHAMAVTACMGHGDAKIVAELPAAFDPSKILFVGLRNWERDEIKARQHQYGIKHLTPEEVAADSDALRAWLKSCGASKVVVHFDMDVLDPAEIVAAVGTDPDGMKIEAVIRVINDIAAEKELVGLTVAEPMPRTAIRLRDMLGRWRRGASRGKGRRAMRRRRVRLHCGRDRESPGRRAPRCPPCPAGGCGRRRRVCSTGNCTLTGGTTASPHFYGRGLRRSVPARPRYPCRDR